MITNYFKKKIFIFSTILLIVFAYFTIYNKNINTTTYQDVNLNIIYLLNDQNYLVKTTMYIEKNNNLINQIKTYLEYLTIDSNKSILINNYYPIIPKNTKVLDINIDNNIIKINFSKEFYNVKPGDEEALIEAIIYTLTELNEIKGIMLFVEGESLNKLPNTNKDIPEILDRSYGINKYYNVNNYKDIHQTTVYYNYQDDYIPVTFVNNNDKEKVEIIIEQLKGNYLNQTNMISYLNASINLEHYEILEHSINLSFNEYIFDNFTNKTITEEVKYALFYSIKDNYDINEVNILYQDNIVSTINLQNSLEE